MWNVVEEARAERQWACLSAMSGHKDPAGPLGETMAGGRLRDEVEVEKRRRVDAQREGTGNTRAARH